MPKVPNDLGNGGARIDTDLKALLNSIVDDLANLRAKVDELVGVVNAQHALSIQPPAPLSTQKSDY